MRGTAGLGAAMGAVVALAASVLLLRCTGTSIEATGAPGTVVVQPADHPGVGLQPTWDLPAPTPLPTPTPTPIA